MLLTLKWTRNGHALKSHAYWASIGFRAISQILCSVLVLSYAPCWIRTNDRLLRRQLLYPAELREQTLQSCQ